MYYPWQTSQWQQLMAAKQAGRLPHALLLSGIAGTGKAVFANSFIRNMLCTQSSPAGYCGQCHSCRLITGNVHPNIYCLAPEKAGAAIKVDQIRGASEFVAQSSFNGEFRFVVIDPAEDMNINAANALLKTLEEPANGAMLILISGESQRMPATILSRCQRIVFPQPEQQAALTWMKAQTDISQPELLLRLANGAPLAALKLAQADTLQQREVLFKALLNKNNDPLKAAAACSDLDLLVFLDYMLSWVMDMLRLQVGLGADELTNRDYQTQLETLKNKTPSSKSTIFLIYLQHLRGQICAGFNLNKQLLMEAVFIRWMDSFGAEA